VSRDLLLHFVTCCDIFVTLKRIKTDFKLRMYIDRTVYAICILKFFLCVIKQQISNFKNPEFYNIV